MGKLQHVGPPGRNHLQFDASGLQFGPPEMNETYEFSFERGQLIKVIGGILSLVVLVFCAGLLVGVALEFREPAPMLVAQSKQLSPQTVAVPVPPVSVNSPAEPVNSEETAVVAADDDDAAIDPNQPAIEDKEDKEDRADKSAVN